MFPIRHPFSALFHYQSLAAPARRLAVLALLAVLAGGCAASEHVDGQIPPPEKIEKIKVGEHTRDDVAEIFGTPSTLPAFDDDTWYYIRKMTRQVAFFDPVVLDQQVLAVTFDKEGRVEGIFRLGESDGRDVSMAEGETATQGRKVTVWEQILGSYGRLPTARAAGPAAGSTTGSSTVGRRGR